MNEIIAVQTNQIEPAPIPAQATHDNHLIELWLHTKALATQQSYTHAIGVFLGFVRAAAKRIGLVDNVSPHWFCHAHASHALDNAAPIHLVQQTLGHASLNTTTNLKIIQPRSWSSQVRI